MIHLKIIQILIMGSIGLSFKPIEKHITVDEVILEHFYDMNTGQLNYTELIFYEFITLNGKREKVVRSWMITSDEYGNKNVDWTKIGEYYVFSIRPYLSSEQIMKRDTYMYKVRSKSFFVVHNHSEMDLERKNRKILHEEKRREIW